MMRSRCDKIADVRKIAVLRVNALGDFLFTLPALDALRAAYPDAEIVLLGKAWHAAFLKNRPGPVDRVVVVPAYGGVGEAPGCSEDPDEQERFFSAMRRERFDLAIQMHGGGYYSNPFVQRLGARMTIGMKAPEAAALDRWIPYVYFQPEILRYLEVVALVGATPTTLEPCVQVTQEDLSEARSALKMAWPPRNLVALHPGAGDPGRRWPAENFARVGDALSAEGARIVVTGTQAEQRLAETVVGAMKAPALNLCGRLSLGGLAGLLSNCRVVVSNDSGPLHLAAAVGAATVGIYWCFNLINAGPLTRTRHRSASSWRLECPVCGANCTHSPCNHHASFVADIPAEDVIGEAVDLFCHY
jgi:ADP-heptose:LPS heptosyltransferase